MGRDIERRTPADAVLPIEFDNPGRVENCFASGGIHRHPAALRQFLRFPADGDMSLADAAQPGELPLGAFRPDLHRVPFKL